MRKMACVVCLRAVAVVATAATMAACDITVGANEFSVREEKKFAVTGPTQLALTTFDGSIVVRGWDRNEVLVEVEKRGTDQAMVDTIQVEATQNGNRITLEVPKPSPMKTGSFGRSPSASLVVSVPLQTTITARSGDGSITIRRVTGSVDLDTEDGSVELEEIKGNCTVRTGDGSVRARDIDGLAKINTGDGSVGVDGRLRAVQVETRDGSISVTARTGSVMDSEWTVTTGDGSIRLELPDGFGANVDARSSDGRVSIDKLTDQGGVDAPRDEHRRGSARGTLGAGGKLLTLRSGSGSITVKAW
jgi:hypothetical protein